MQFADPKNNLAFKKIFGDENHKNILISFLNSILDLKGMNSIVTISLSHPYEMPRGVELKETILDIKATNKKGAIFIIEIQKKELDDFTKQNLYNTSKTYMSQLPKGDDYTGLKKVYFISLLNFTLFENVNYISKHLIINQETGQQDLDDFEFRFIELPKFVKELDMLETVLDKWLYFIKNASTLEHIPTQYKENKVFTEAFDIATQTKWNSEELEIYESISLGNFDEHNALKTAEQKGMQKRDKEIATNLLDILDNETIALKTGLNETLIESLRR